MHAFSCMFLMKGLTEDTEDKKECGKGLYVKNNDKHIGIGTPIAERPSHSTGRTGHVSGGSAGQSRNR